MMKTCGVGVGLPDFRQNQFIIVKDHISILTNLAVLDLTKLVVKSEPL